MVVLVPHALPHPALTVGFDSKDYAPLHLEFSSTSKMADRLTDDHSVMLSIRDQQEAAEWVLPWASVFSWLGLNVIS